MKFLFVRGSAVAAAKTLREGLESEPLLMFTIVPESHDDYDSANQRGHKALSLLAEVEQRRIWFRDFADHRITSAEFVDVS